MAALILGLILLLLGAVLTIVGLLLIIGKLCNNPLATFILGTVVGHKLTK